MHCFCFIKYVSFKYIRPNCTIQYNDMLHWNCEKNIQIHFIHLLYLIAVVVIRNNIPTYLIVVIQAKLFFKLYA